MVPYRVESSHLIRYFSYMIHASSSKKFARLQVSLNLPIRTKSFGYHSATICRSYDQPKVRQWPTFVMSAFQSNWCRSGYHLRIHCYHKKFVEWKGRDPFLFVMKFPIKKAYFSYFYQLQNLIKKVHFLRQH